MKYWLTPEDTDIEDAKSLTINEIRSYIGSRNHGPIPNINIKKIKKVNFLYGKFKKQIDQIC